MSSEPITGGSVYPYQTACPACGQPTKAHGFVDGTAPGGRRTGFMVGFCDCPGFPEQAPLMEMEAPEPGPWAKELGNALRDIRFGPDPSVAGPSMREVCALMTSQGDPVKPSVMSAWQFGRAVPEPDLFAAFCRILQVDPARQPADKEGWRGRPLLAIYEAARQEVYGPDARHGLHMCRTCGVRPASWFEIIPVATEGQRPAGDQPFCGMCGAWAAW